MSILGTKKFWKPVKGSSKNQKENQILKNSGYINLQLRCVNYMSKGNFWQSTFGGKDKIVLTTNLKYQMGRDSIEASSVQDIREIKVDKNYNLGIQRNIAVKIPANSDALSIDVKMTAVKNDSLQNKFEMLNEPEYQAALQLTPTIVGQLITVTSLVKKLLTDSNPNTQLEASFAGIISNQSENNPVSNGKLTKGSLIMISTNDGERFENVDESKFELRGDTLYYNKRQVENTHIVFNISFESLKGNDEHSLWFKKYVAAINKLYDIEIAEDDEEIKKIYSDSKKLWIEGNALLDADSTYINQERRNIKNAAIKSIKDKYKEMTKTVTKTLLPQDNNEILAGLTGSTSINEIKVDLPCTGSFLDSSLNIDPNVPIKLNDINKIDIDDNQLSVLLETDLESYLEELKMNNIRFNLWNQK